MRRPRAATRTRRNEARVLKHPIYLLFGATVLLVLAGAELRGWSPFRATQVKDVPRSVRDNPGAYRSIYIGRTGGRYMRGK